MLECTTEMLFIFNATVKWIQNWDCAILNIICANTIYFICLHLNVCKRFLAAFPLQRTPEHGEQTFTVNIINTRKEMRIETLQKVFVHLWEWLGFFLRRSHSCFHGRASVRSRQQRIQRARNLLATKWWKKQGKITYSGVLSNSSTWNWTHLIRNISLIYWKSSKQPDECIIKANCQRIKI